MFCGFCGKTIRDEAVFCPFCGQPVKVRTAEAGEASHLQEAKVDLKERFTPTLPHTPDSSETKNAQPLKDETRWKEEPKRKPWQPPVMAMPAVEPTVLQTPAPRPAPAGNGGTKPPAAPKKPVPAPATPKRPAPASKNRQAARSPLKSRPTRQIRNDRIYFVLSLISKLALLLIPLAAFFPYCRIAYSADRSAGMALWKLILGGTYTMGSSNPLVFTLKAQPKLAVLLAIPLLALLIGCFRRTRIKAPAASLMLLGDGLGLLILNVKLFRAIQSAVYGLSLETFERYVISMNDVVIRWIQSAVAGKTATEDTFYATGRLGFWLLLLFSAILLILGVVGFVLWLKGCFKKDRTSYAENDPEDDERMDDLDDDDVPELGEDLV